MSERRTTERFTGRAAFYAKYRPGYPRALLDDLLDKGIIPSHGRVADLGAGTGIFTALLLERGLTVYAVEPNDDMRRAAEERLSGREGFFSVDGRAEGTGLPGGSIEAATAAQSYHWFEPEPTRAELRRILVPRGWVVLLWNERRKDQDEFSREYEDLVNDFSPEHATIERSKEDPRQIFEDLPFERLSYDNDRRLDLEWLSGAAASVSHLPKPGDATYDLFRARLDDLFARHERGGKVNVSMSTHCCFGRLD
jgi:SAM-dependent methyltransferase